MSFKLSSQSEAERERALELRKLNEALEKIRAKNVAEECSTPEGEAAKNLPPK